MRRVCACLSIALLLSLGCDDGRAGTPPEPAAPPARAPETETETEPPADCTLGRVEVLLDHARARRGLAMGGGLVAALDDGLTTKIPDHVAERRARPGLERMFVLAYLQTHWIVGEGTCPESAHCLHVVEAFDEAPARTIPLPGRVVTSRRAVDDESFLFAWSAAGGARGLERWTWEDDALVHRSIPLGDEPASEEMPTEILGLAADGDRWAVVWRRGATEDAESEVFVDEPGRHRTVESLHEALTIESIAFDGDALALIAGFEFSRPGFVRLTGDGPERRLVAADETPPAPFAERVRAELDVDDEGLWLRRRDGAGDSLGARVRITEGPLEMAAIERRSGIIRVAWATADGLVHVRDVQCGAAPRG